MYQRLEQRLARLADSQARPLFQGARIGLEKESLRVNNQGSIAQTPHPRALGSALTHPYITTDYSEALLEFITPPYEEMHEALHFLCDLQTFVYRNLCDEILWATSMPCVLAGETSIPVAKYGDSNPGMMKTVYRRGLGHRYGRIMQVIAGVHFNYSLPDAFWDVYQASEGHGGERRAFVDDGYFGMIRNLQRFGWLIPYLFGASPAVCRSFLNGRSTDMELLGAGTYYEPYATSLRMGDIGYTNNREDQTGVKACYDSIDAYVDSLTRAIETPYPEYERMGVVAHGEYQQLNANLLQIENEYYSTIRPKQPLEDMEKPTQALRQRGVKYVELRSLDVNAFDPLGINEIQIRFLEAFMVFCLLHESPTISACERGEIDRNQLDAAHRGRDPELLLRRHGTSIALRDWAAELMTAMEGVCELMDREAEGHPYSEALAVQRATVQDPERTPSARMLAEMRDNGESFFEFALRMSEKHHRYFLSRPLPGEREALFRDLAGRSLAEQAEIEAANDEPFADFLARYFAQR